MKNTSLFIFLMFLGGSLLAQGPKADREVLFDQIMQSLQLKEQQTVQAAKQRQALQKQSSATQAASEDSKAAYEHLPEKTREKIAAIRKDLKREQQQRTLEFKRRHQLPQN